MAVKRYDGSAWQTVAGLGAQGPAATSSSIATWVKTASGGETSVSGNDDNSQPLSYTVGQELVFINGVLQKRGDDYTATTGNSITGLTALTAGDIVSVWTVNAFSVTNAISNTIVDAKGDILVGTGADTPGRLAVGTNDYVLTADSTTGTGLKWAAPAAGGGMTLINTGGTALTGASVTVSSIPGTYKHLYVVVEDIYCATTLSALYVRFNGDTGSNYTWSYVRNIATTLAGSYNTGTSINVLSRLPSTNTSNKKGQILIQLPRYTNTTPKSLQGQAYGHDDTNPANQVTSATYTGGSAISSITVFGDYNFSGGTIYVYGVN